MNVGSGRDSSAVGRGRTSFDNAHCVAGRSGDAGWAAAAEEIWNGKAVTASSFEVSHDVDAVPVPQLLELFASAWWAAGRTEAETRGILAGSDVVVAVTDRSSGRLVGFARVLTDRTHLALVLDVIAAPDFRGVGIGAVIMDAVLAHPWVGGVRSVELVCQPELVAFYRRWGFTDEVGQSRLMRRTARP
jgi:GNAT superfamily N-acetyltransferase